MKKLIILLILTILTIIATISGCANPAGTAETSGTLQASQTSEIPETSEPTEQTEQTEQTEILTDNPRTDGFIFANNGTTVYLDEYAERVLNELPPPSDYFEGPSCSFDGTAKIYFYGGFEISTYMKTPTDKDRVYSVTFDDDSVATAEGIYIGLSFDEAVSVYGSDYKSYEDIPGYYRYEKSGTILAFNVDPETGVIASITIELLSIYD